MRLIWLSLCLTTLLFVPTGLSAQGPPRQLAPGALKVIPADPDPRDSFSLPMPLPGLDANDYQPNFASKQHTLFGQTRNIVLFRDVWQFEFSFLALRQARLEVARLDGTTSTENIWYLVYRIRDTGATLTYQQVKDDPRFDYVKNDLRRNDPNAKIERRFLPRFVLEGWVKEAEGDSYRKVVYRDTPSPTVLRQIQHLEDPNLPLLDTTTISQTEIPSPTSDGGGGVWGVAVWHGVDPELDYVSVFVEGLTNAYRIEEQTDGSVVFKRRTLQLNFWRPGDSVAQEKDKIDYGIPLVDDPRQQVAITRRYDLPGPLIRGYFVSPKANRNVQVMEVDAEVNLDDFKSELTSELDAGKMPATVNKGFADAGIPLPTDTAVTPLVKGIRWSLQVAGETGQQEYVLQLEPQYWEPDGSGIRFIRSLDYMWIYR